MVSETVSQAAVCILQPVSIKTRKIKDKYFMFHLRKVYLYDKAMAFSYFNQYSTITKRHFLQIYAVVLLFTLKCLCRTTSSGVGHELILLRSLLQSILLPPELRHPSSIYIPQLGHFCIYATSFDVSVIIQALLYIYYPILQKGCKYEIIF